MSSFRLPWAITRQIQAHLAPPLPFKAPITPTSTTSPILTLLRRQFSSVKPQPQPLALRNLLQPPRPSAAPSRHTTGGTPRPSAVLATLRRAFGTSPVRSVRSTYFSNGPRGGGGYGSGGSGGGGWFDRMKRKVDQQDPAHIIYALIGINVAVFLLWQYALSSARRFRDPTLWSFMQKNFVLSEYNLLSGRIWTVITSCFSHSSGSHIFVNCLGLYFIAPAALAVLGGSGFLGLYLVGGIVSSVASVLWHRMNRNSKHFGSEGASGAIYSTFGFYGMMFPQAKILMFFIIPMPIWVAIAGIVGYDIFESITHPTSRTDVAAHIGGIAFGLFSAWRYKRGYRMFRR